MGFLDDALTAIGVVSSPAAPSLGAAASATGVTVRFTRDLAPVPATGLAEGQLLEVVAVLDERHEVTAVTALQIDLVEQDVVSGDRILSLVGTGATAPATAALACTTVFATVPSGRDVTWTIRDHVRTRADHATTILVVTERPASSPPALAALRRTHVVAWLRPTHADTGAVSEYTATLLVDGTAVGSAPTIEIGPAPPGVAVRVTGAIADADVPANPLFGLLPDVDVTLRGRWATTGADGRFALDARLPVGAHVLRIERPGITARELTVDVTRDAAGLATAALRDGTDVLATTTTAVAATATSLLALDVALLPVYVHTLRGTILWPESRTDNAGAFRRTPLAEHRVYVLPLPDGADIAAHRPKTTRAWEALAARRGVLRSARIGEQPLGARTGPDGRFEVRYVDLTPGKRHLLWVQRLDGDDADTVTEAPVPVVRSETRDLRRLTRANLVLGAQADVTVHEQRKVVDHEYNITRDPVAWGVEALRVEDYGGATGVRLVRPQRRSRDGFDAAATPAVPRPALATVAATALTTPPRPAGAPPNPPARRADVDLDVLPLVTIDVDPDDRGVGAQRAQAALARTGRAAFPDGHRLGTAAAGVPTLAVDVRRLSRWTALDGAAVADGWTADEVTPAARAVALLEATFVLRHDLTAVVRGGVRTAGMDRATWHVDAVTLADRSTAHLAGGSLVTHRTLGADLTFGLWRAPAPLLAAVGPRPVYVAPGHGLWQTGGGATSANPNQWVSNRGGYQLNAGEDEVDALMARTVKHLLERSGATVTCCRAVDDLNLPGVANNAPGVFTDVVADAFPRLWQQNPVYAFGQRADPHVIHHAKWAADWGNPGGGKNGDGIYARGEHIRSLARAGRIAIVVALHTNAGGGAATGTLVEYLNAHPPADPDTLAANAAGNPNGASFAALLTDRIIARAGTRRNGGIGARSMKSVDADDPVRDLVDTFDHWARETPGVEEQDQERVAPGLPIGVAVAANHWVHHPFPVDAPAPAGHVPPWLPVALAEIGFHDNPAEAAFLSRQWFRQRAAEGVALAVDDQLQLNPAPITRADVRTVLGRLFGATATVQALANVPAVATAAHVADALAAVVAVPADLPPPAAPPARPVTTLGGLLDAARAAATALTRRQLVDLVSDAVRGPAGWETTDSADVRDRWITVPIAGPGPLERGPDIPTRAEAGQLACRAIGLTPASVTVAQARAVGAPAIPLLDPAADADEAWFTRVGARLLVGRLQRMTPAEVHRVVAVTLVDGGWVPLARSTHSDRYVLHQGTPVTVVVRTGGVPWKTVGQGVFPDVADVDVRVQVGSDTRRLACVRREPTRVVSNLWVLDVPPTTVPVPVTVSLRLRHRVDGWQLVGAQAVTLQVLPTPPA